MKRRIEFGEGDEVLGPIRGVMDNGKNPSQPYAAAVGAVPLDLKGELYQVRGGPSACNVTTVHRTLLLQGAHECVAQRTLKHTRACNLPCPCRATG